MANGVPNPTAVHPELDPITLLANNVRTHKAPVPQEKEPCERIEGNVVSRAFRVVVRRRKLRSSSVEAATAESGGQAGCSSGEHLAYRQHSFYTRGMVSLPLLM